MEGELRLRRVGGLKALWIGKKLWGSFCVVFIVFKPIPISGFRFLESLTRLGSMDDIAKQMLSGQQCPQTESDVPCGGEDICLFLGKSHQAPLGSSLERHGWPNLDEDTP